MPDVIADLLYPRLFADAERVRWEMERIAWDRIDRTRVTPELCERIKETAFSELTTTTATTRFLTDWADDADFTQWLAVWFYEETKHPHVLLRWLAAVGTTVDVSFLTRGRVTAPFMRSRMGMLVTNIVSEMVAAAGYASLSERTDEPVLRTIALHLAADEARHAASFYAYARRHLERSKTPDDDRRDALKVLYLWLSDGANLRHPVNVRARAEGDDFMPRDRIVRLVGTLVDLPLTSPDEILSYVQTLGTPPPQGAA